MGKETPDSLEQALTNNVIAFRNRISEHAKKHPETYIEFFQAVQEGQVMVLPTTMVPVEGQPPPISGGTFTLGDGNEILKPPKQVVAVYIPLDFHLTAMNYLPQSLHRVVEHVVQEHHRMAEPDNIDKRIIASNFGQAVEGLPFFELCDQPEEGAKVVHANRINVA